MTRPQTSTHAMEIAGLELEARLQRNLALFEAAAGDDFRYRHHTPTRFAVRWNDEGGYVTLADLTQGGAAVYPGDPREWARSQVAGYTKAARPMTVENKPIELLAEEGIVHVVNSNRAMRLIQAVPQEVPQELPGVVNFMLMLGCGLAYQVEALLEQTDVRHLCIIEPEADIFHASLHTVDWLPILRHFSGEGRTLELIIDEDPPTCYDRLDTWLSEIGGFNIVRPYVFQHLVSHATAACYDSFPHRIMPEQTSSLGYFDDEQVGIAHTIRNLEAGTPVLRGGVPGVAAPRPVFIVANGPSLDRSIDAIRRNRDRAVVVSCGTTLGSLMKAGIRPDIHVEMERDSEMREWIEAATTPEDREHMLVLGLNTVHPDVFGLFPAGGMAMKSNDLGTSFATDRVIPAGGAVALANCNPTVANCALALTAALGFRKVYLFGVDFGFPEGGKHHSELSIHYDVRDEDQAALGIWSADDARNPRGPGNFGGTVTTTTLYRSAAQAAARAVASAPDLTCFNLGSGLRIEGTTPLRPEDLRLSNAPFSTQAAARDVVRAAFARREMGTKGRAEAESIFDGLAETMAALEDIADTEIHSLSEGLAVLDRMHALVRALLADEHERYLGGALKGSVGMFSLLLAQALHRTTDLPRNLELYRGCRELFVAFCRSVREKAAQEALASDERRRDLEAKLA